MLMLFILILRRAALDRADVTIGEATIAHV